MSIIQIKDNCTKANISFPLIRTMEDQLEAVADYYWVCGGKKIKGNISKRLERHVYESKNATRDNVD